MIYYNITPAVHLIVFPLVCSLNSTSPNYCSDYIKSGNYSCLAKNKVKNNVEKEDIKSGVVTVSKTVAVSSSQSRSVQYFLDILPF